MLTFKRLLNLFIILTAALFINACSQNSQAIKDTFLLYLDGKNEITLTPEQVDAIPYASIYAGKGNGNRAFLVLAYAEPISDSKPDLFQLKWLSASNEMITTEEGRIVKTFNFLDGNLLASYAKEPDPLALGLLNPSTPKKWQHYLDWQPGNYHHVRVDSTFLIAQKQNIEINGKTVLAQHVIENVSVPELDTQYQNQFWLDPDTQKVIASIQRPAPFITAIEIQILKPFIGT